MHTTTSMPTVTFHVNLALFLHFFQRRTFAHKWHMLYMGQTPWLSPYQQHQSTKMGKQSTDPNWPTLSLLYPLWHSSVCQVSDASTIQNAYHTSDHSQCCFSCPHQVLLLTAKLTQTQHKTGTNVFHKETTKTGHWKFWNYNNTLPLTRTRIASLSDIFPIPFCATHEYVP